MLFRSESAAARRDVLEARAEEPGEQTEKDHAERRDAHEVRAAKRGPDGDESGRKTQGSDQVAQESEDQRINVVCDEARRDDRGAEENARQCRRDRRDH